MNINEEKTIHIYQDETTGNRYFFDGKKLVYIGKAKNVMLGSRGDEDEYQKELDRHNQEVAKELEDSGEQGESEEDRKARIDRINDLLNSKDFGDEVVKETEDKVKIEKERQEKLRKIKSSSEANYYSSGDLQKFKLDLKKFIADQVKAVKKGTWKIENQKYADSGIIRKTRRKQKDRTIPSINVYFDQSASWGESDLQRGREAIGVLNEYVQKKLIKISVYYFANTIHSNAADARREGGTGAGKELIDHIISTKPKNVIVITDDDFDGWGEIKKASRVTIPGVAMFLFRRGQMSKELLKKLHGKQHNKVYDF